VGAARELRIGTRGSQLALWQANTVAARIAEAGGPPCLLVVIKTSGDRLQEAPLSEVGGKRLFVKEIEDALLKGDIDLAVHSSKDMPAELPADLAIAGVLPREDPHDAVVLPHAARERERTAVASIEELVAILGQTASIGTGSVRRVAQLARLLPGARFTAIRGNLDTRLRKVDAGEHDALVLAAAGLRRLGFASRITYLLPASACVPAPGQGIVAIETRTDAADVRQIVMRITDASAAAELAAERAVVEKLGGGCQTPVGALATLDGAGALDLVAIVVALDGSRAVRANARGSAAGATALGVQVAERLLAEGAGDILADTRKVDAAVEGIQP
jgi:hydroxymethylbilane synthase